MNTPPAYVLVVSLLSNEGGYSIIYLCLQHNLKILAPLPCTTPTHPSEIIHTPIYSYVGYIGVLYKVIVVEWLYYTHPAPIVFSVYHDKFGFLLTKRILKDKHITQYVYRAYTYYIGDNK